MKLGNLIRKITDRYDLFSVWSDFVEMCAVSISNRVHLDKAAEREQRYRDIARRYNQAEMTRITEAFGALVLDFSDDRDGNGIRFDDVLGRTFMELELGNKWAGQFFSPFELCRAMARLSAYDVKAQLDDKPFITASDPAVGGGAMLIALAAELHDVGVSYQERLHVTAQDIDIRACHMAYVQLSLLHIPAHVVVGDTLRMEQRDHWFTPAHILGGWSLKLHNRRRAEERSQLPSESPGPNIEPQLSLF